MPELDAKGYLAQLLRAYQLAAIEVCGRMRSWIDDNWRELIAPDLLDNGGARFYSALASARDEWRGRNVLIGDLLDHICASHGPQEMADPIGGSQGQLKQAFLESINIFLAVKIDYTVRVLFSSSEPAAPASADGQADDFDIDCFPFLDRATHPGIKSPLMKRIMQLAFAEGSYHVDFRAPGMAGVIGACIQSNVPYVENDVAASTRETSSRYPTRTVTADTDLGISSVVYLPLCPEKEMTAPVVIGIYSPVRGLFASLSATSDECRTLRTQFLGIGPFARLAEATEMGLKEVARRTVFQTMRQILNTFVMTDAVIRSLGDTCGDARMSGDLPCSLHPDLFRKALSERLLRHIGRHGEALLPFVSKAEGGGVAGERFDLCSWWREDVPAHAPQVLADLANYFEARVETPSEPVWVRGDRAALCGVLQALIHNAIQYRAGQTDRAPLHLLLSGPNDELRYGIIRIQTPANRLSVPPGLSAVDFAVLLRQGVPIMTAGGHGFGLYWCRCILEAADGRLQIDQLRSPGVIDSRTRMDSMMARYEQGVAIDEIVADYRKGIEVTICLQLA